MASHDLRSFISELERAGELKRIKHGVSAKLEITEIADRVIKQAGPALLFENVAEAPDVPLAIGLYGNHKRLAMALHDAPENIAARIEGLVKTVPPEGWMAKIQTGLKLLPTLKSLGTKTVTDGPCKEVKLIGEAADLTRLPVLTCWPDDGGPFITLPMVFTHNPNTGRRNVGMYRVQIYDARTTGMHWQIHKVGAHHAREAAEKEQKIEAAICLGGDPCLPFCAIAPLPEEIDEMMFAGFLRGTPVEMVRCETIDVMVPADCEYVIEGTIDPNEMRAEGPFGDHTGYYTPIEDYPVFRVTAITHRKKPIYPATIVGIPPMEDAYLGGAVGTIFKPLIKTQIPELVDMHLPVEACFHNLAIVSIKKRYPNHAYKVMHALWGLGQLMFSKVIVVVDDDVDVHNWSEVVWRMTNNIDPARDVQIVKGPVDSLNHAAPMVGFGSKMGIDATRKWPSEGHTREWPEVVKMDRGTAARVDAMWSKLGLGDLIESPSIDGHIVAPQPHLCSSKIDRTRFMKLLVFSDVHGNRFGLEAVIEHAQGNYDAALCLGDVVGYGAHPNECCELVREVTTASPNGACLMGNHDAAALGIIDASWFNHVASAAIQWTDEQLNEKNRAWLESLSGSLAPDTIGAFQAVHGSLRQPLEEYIVDAETAVATLELMEAPLCFYGHTHVAQSWSLGASKRNFFKRLFELQGQSLRQGGRVIVAGNSKLLINPGSCGQPRDGNRQARYAIYDSEAGAVEVFAIDYDWQSASDAIYAAGLPPMLGDRLIVGR